jgi:hypothetical protein
VPDAVGAPEFSFIIFRGQRIPMKLRMNMADYLVTLGMNNERVVSPLVSLDFCGPQTAHDGLKGMLR